MNYPTSFNIIVIVLSVTLFIFLVMGILVLVQVLKITKSAKRATLKAEEVANNFASISKLVEGRALVSMFTSIFSKFSKKNKDTKK